MTVLQRCLCVYAKASHAAQIEMMLRMFASKGGSWDAIPA